MQAGPSQKRDAPPTNRPKKKSIRFNGLGNRRNPGKQWTGARRGDQSGLGQVKIKDILVKKWTDPNLARVLRKPQVKPDRVLGVLSPSTKGRDIIFCLL